MDIIDLILYTYKQANPEAHALKSHDVHASPAVEVPYVSSVVTPSTSLKEDPRFEFGLERGQGTDQLGASLFEGSSWRDLPFVWIFTKKYGWSG